MIGRTFIVKYAKNLSDHNAKKSRKNSVTEKS